jgi:hypothetical protein
MVLCYDADDILEDNPTEECPLVQPIFRRVSRVVVAVIGIGLVGPAVETAVAAATSARASAAATAVSVAQSAARPRARRRPCATVARSPGA